MPKIQSVVFITFIFLRDASKQDYEIYNKAWELSSLKGTVT